MYYLFSGDSTQGRLQAGATTAITPSGQRPDIGHKARSLSRPGSSTGGGSFAHPVARSSSACFPVTKTPSAQGLAMIKTTEKTPPPTDMAWEEALSTLHYMEKQLTIEVASDIDKLRLRMTSSKIDLVARKSKRLYQMRLLLRSTRRMCREEEDIMADFSGVKATMDTNPHSREHNIDDDDYSSTKNKLLKLGGKLTDIKRKQQRLAGQVEELQIAMTELVDMSQVAEIEGYEFNMESFKRESSALPEMPKLCQILPSYDLFNSAPYAPDSRPGSAMSMASRGSVSPAPPSLLTDRHRTIKVSVAVDSTDDEDLPADTYLPQRSGGLRHKKQKSGVGRRPATSTDVSDTESEDSCYQYTNTNDRMTPAEAKIKAEDEKKKAIMEGKQKAAAEKTAKLEEKKQAEENKKKAELDAKRKEEQAKKKAETDAKKAKEEEAQKKKDDVAAKKKADADAKKEAEQEAKKKEKEEAAKKLAAEEESKRLAEEEEQKKKDEIAAKKKAGTDAKKAAAQKRKEEEANAKAEEEAAKKAADEEAQKKKEDIAAKKKATEQTMKDMEAKAQLEDQEAKRAADEQASIE